MDKVHRFIAGEPGERLDKYICQQLPELSRSRVQRLIADGYIIVNSQPAKPGLRLNTGDRIKVTVPPTPSSQLLPESIPLNIIYEDEDLLVLDKPDGLTVHPAPGHASHTLVNALLSHFPHLADVGDRLRPGIVHRLDKDTSGLMLVAKNAKAQDNLAGQFKSHSVTKAYIVLVRGHLTPKEGIIEANIGRALRHRQKMAVVEGGREARTEYKVIKYIGDYSLLEVRPQTGRTHQIRVHLAAIGFPVVGDKVYGVKAPFLSRQFLHASLLGFRLPSTGEYLEFKSELPADLEQALEDIA
jgi:23S rRNA pseudouridine1911/1915/1917 synthase